MRKQGSARAKRQSAGLPETSKPASPLESGFVAIGKLRRPHGVKGDMLFEVMTDFPDRIKSGKSVFVGDGYREEKITAKRNHHIGMILHLEGYDSPEDAGVLRNQLVYASIADLPDLPDGEIYFHKLIGMSVVTVEGDIIGILNEIMETGANDVLIIQGPDGGEILLPDIESVVLGVDTEKDQIVVQPPEWL